MTKTNITAGLDQHQKMRAQLYTKLFKAKQNINPVKKDGVNPHFRNSYPTLNSLIEAVEPALNEQGLYLSQPICDGEQATFITDIETGEFVSSFMKLPDLDNPQKVKSCSTYYRRTTLSGLLSMRDSDDDGNEASGKSPKYTDNQLHALHHQENQKKIAGSNKNLLDF